MKLRSAFVYIVLSVFGIKSESTTLRPFVLFKNDGYFDPFRENEIGASASAVQPNAVFGAYSQPFKHYPKLAGSLGYPRAIGLLSGNSNEFNAQIWQPSSFMAKFASEPVKQDPILRPLPIFIDQSNSAVVPYILPSKKAVPFSRSTHLGPKNGALQTSYTEHTDHATANSQPSNTIGHASRLVAASSDFESHSSPKSTSKSAGGGKEHEAAYHKSHGDKEEQGHKSDHHHNNVEHEKHDDHHKESHHKEKGGNHKDHHDEAGHYKKYHEGKESHKAAKFGEKKGHKRGHKTKGYHNKFHRDEYHREHRFYDDAHKEGYHEKHGDAHSHYDKKEGSHKSGKGHKSGHSAKKHGRKDFSNKGKHVDNDKGFSREGGRKKHHNHHRDYRRKHGNARGKEYGYHKEQ